MKLNDNCVIVVNGGRRTASTLAFNVCLKIAQRSGRFSRGFVSTGMNADDIENLIASKRDRPYFVKSHTFAPAEIRSNIMIVHTIRNPMDVAASLVRWEKETSEAEIAKELRQQISFAVRHLYRDDTIILPYELTTEVNSCARVLSRWMAIALSYSDFAGIAAELEINRVAAETRKIKNGANVFTQFRRNHITNPSGSLRREDFISPELVELINKELM